MAQITIKNLSFRYSLGRENCLEKINLEINEGEFVVLCGKSGCGKTTLLRQLKPAIVPKGEREGKIYLNGTELDKTDLRTQSEKIGFVMQNPESQIVTDKVWHELAFGLENLGMKTAEIRLRVSEMASYFGIDDWFDKKTTELSGGQKQILNLAAVMAMHPDILILDEPTSRLDPIAADRFLETVNKIHKDLGVTVIITEHRLEDIFSFADRIVVMDCGKIIADDKPKRIGEIANELPKLVKLSLPATVKIFAEANGKGEAPVCVRDGRNWLKNQKIICKKIERKNIYFSEKNAIELKNISFKYEKNTDDILNSLSLKIPQGSVFALLGGNGAGKSTLFKVIVGSEKPYNGKIKINGTVAAMPQEVQTLFASRTVKEELSEMSQDNEKIEKVANLTQIKNLFDSHPFDLSGGEQQRVAVAKLLLCERDIYFFDEPTKGMDAEFKKIFSEILSELKAKDKTVIIISHDIDFCAENAELCAMLFDKNISAVNTTDEFFDGNRFYTTAANKISEGFIDGAITNKDVIKCLKK